MGCRADGGHPHVSRKGRKACKKVGVFCTRKVSNQKEKAVRSPVFPRFPHTRKFLCGKKFSSLRQERNFFPQRNSIFAAQKRPPWRRNASYGQFSCLFFNNSGAISTLSPRHDRAEQSGKTYFLTAFTELWRHSGNGIIRHGTYTRQKFPFPSLSTTNGVEPKALLDTYFRFLIAEPLIEPPL